MVIMLFLAGSMVSLCAQHTVRQDRSRYYEQLVGNMIQQMKLIQDENARLAETVQDLSRRLAALERENKRLSSAADSFRQNTGAEKEAARSHYRELLEKNRHLENKIHRLEKLIRDVGRVADLPAGRGKGRKQKERTSGTSQAVDCVEHTVEKGHVLYNIAKAYQVSVQEIRRINHLKSDKLFIGQKLLIPVKKER